MHSPTNWSEVVHEEGLEGLREIKARGFKLILITNQPDIERKILSQSFVDELNGYYQEKYGLDATYTCPFSSNEHPDKKPNPGLLLRAKSEHQIDFEGSFFVGDTERDMEASTRCNISFILYSRDYNKSLKAARRINSLTELTTIIN